MRKSIFMVLLSLILAVPAFAVNKAPLKELIVASDGEYTSISAALASLPTPNPDTNPVVIKVMPGTYSENITMKSNVHLQGAGHEVTTIETNNAGYPGSEIVTFNNVTNTSISGFRIRSNNTPNNNTGIWVKGSSPVIRNNRIENDKWDIYNEASAAPVIKDNVIVPFQFGVYNDNSSPVIINNELIGTNDTIGVENHYSSAVISGNVMTGFGNASIYSEHGGNKITNNILNLGTGSWGIYEYNTSSTISGNVITGSPVQSWGLNVGGSGVTMINNKITGNIGGHDIYGCGGANLSFNVFDTKFPASCAGSYNVKSDGTPW